MNQIELAKIIGDIFEKMGVEYMLVGSMASTYYGEARMTADVDMVADLEYEQVREFVKCLPESEYFVQEHVIKEAIWDQGMFNIRHKNTGYRVDVFIPKKGEFSKLELANRKKAEFSGLQIFIAAPEYIILNKLEYYKEGKSEKHLRDISTMIQYQGDRINFGLIDEWAEKLGLAETWRDFLTKFQAKQKKKNNEQ